MTYEMLGTSSISALRAACDPFDLPSNSPTNSNGFSNPNFPNNSNNGASNFPFKPLAMTFSPSPSPIRPHLTIAEQAELEFELRYRGNMIVDQQRKIQQLEEDLKRTRDQMDMMNSQLNTYEQERQKEKKKPQSRYWTPDEHQRFLEALTKYGHKDVKAISMHVSTRNATQVRTHAQKYFLRLERERRKKNDEEGGKLDKDDLYDSSGDELYGSDLSASPIEELSPPPAGISSPIQVLSQSPQPTQSNTPPMGRRRRSTSLIAPAMGKCALQHQNAVLAELPNWSSEDYEQFAKGLLSLIDKTDLDIGQVCRAIRDGFVPHRSVEDVEMCYKQLHKIIKQKPAVLIAPIGSPKRRRTSKPELPINMPSINEGPLPAMGTGSPISSGNGFVPFMGNMSNMSGPPLPPPQYMNTNSINTNHSSHHSSNNHHHHNSPQNSPVTLLPFQSPQMGGLMNMNMNVNMNMRPLMDYGNVPSMQALQISNLGMGMSNLGMMDIGTPSSPSTSPNHQWNSLALSFDLHQNSSLALHHGAPLVPSLN